MPGETKGFIEGRVERGHTHTQRQHNEVKLRSLFSKGETFILWHHSIPVTLFLIYHEINDVATVIVSDEHWQSSGAVAPSTIIGHICTLAYIRQPCSLCQPIGKNLIQKYRILVFFYCILYIRYSWFNIFWFKNFLKLTVVWQCFHVI